MRKKDFTLLVGAAAILAMSWFNHARAAETSFCAFYDEAKAMLYMDHGEVPVAGWNYKGVFRVLFANQETGKGTMLAVDPSGYACTMYSVDGFTLPGERSA